MKTKLLAQLDMSFSWKPDNWWSKFTISSVILWWFQFFIMALQINFGSILKLPDVGFLKAHLPTYIVPSTSTPYLGSRSEIIWSALELAYVNGKPPHWQQWEYNNISWLSDLAGQSTSTHLFVLVNMHLGTLTPTLSVSCLALVNNFHQ